MDITLPVGLLTIKSSFPSPSKSPVVIKLGFEFNPVEKSILVAKSVFVIVSLYGKNVGVKNLLLVAAKLFVIFKTEIGA